MKDIPIFNTDHGIASLMLKEIPYKEIAYIQVQDVQPGQMDLLIDECAAFCRAAGAEQIYLCGHDAPEGYPLVCRLVLMSGPADQEYEGNLWPVTRENVEQFRSIYNEKMSCVDHSQTLTRWDEKRIIDSGGAYFVHRDGKLLGIGWVDENTILCLASMIPGEGRNVLGALLSVVDGDTARVEVASTNARAIHLYEKMGFVQTGEGFGYYKVR